jgi:single-stranded-DNA-specific exonuclease
MAQHERRKIIQNEASEDVVGLPDDLHPVLRRIYAARGVVSEDELDYELSRLPAPSSLPGVTEAAALLHRILEQDGRILVIGDFDADGATSSALAVRALRAMGCEAVNFLVPNRFEYGYGLTPEIVAEALKQSPDLLLTVDNGISSLDGVSVAREAGVKVLVTDHHLPGEQLPQADVIVNPQLVTDGSFDGASLAGVGVIFYVMAGLRSHLREQDWFSQRGIPEPNLAELLDLVALGTVADVVPLDRVNRILVHQGLQRIRAGHCRPGILALFQAAGRNHGRTGASDLGFSIGPRLNAAGRLEDMTQGIDCLLTEDDAEAKAIARELDSLNRQRREIEADMKQQALAELEGTLLDQAPEALPYALAVFHQEWHQGVIGILAARLRERYHRPAIAFAPAEEGMIKGSARSIPGLHIRDALDGVAARHPELLSKFGGHAMAAGLSLQERDLEPFRRALEQEVRSHLTEQDLQGVAHSDGALDSEDVGLELAELLRNGGPWGQAFPEPQFDNRLRVLNSRVVGENHLKMVLAFPGSDTRIDAIAFNQAEGEPLAGVEEIHAVYRLDVNEYMGSRKPQLIIEYFESV